MSWAAARQNDRDEDIAYSLLGIFDVNMSLIYGEGTKAFIRLQQEIIRSNEDQSIFAWDRSSEFRGSNESVLSATGVLADSPAWFRHSGNIVPCNLGDTWDPPAITSRGLYIQSPVVFVEVVNEHRDQDYLLLKCRRMGDLFHILAIPIRRSTSFYETQYSLYAREMQCELLRIPGEDWKDMVKKRDPRRIYLVPPKENTLSDLKAAKLRELRDCHPHSASWLYCRRCSSTSLLDQR